MICLSLSNKTHSQILEALEDPRVEMAEIRLDSCPLTDAQIEDLFSNCEIPLVATCRIENCGAAESERRMQLSAQAGARYADLELDAPSDYSRRFQKVCKACGTELIRSYHNMTGTPDSEMLDQILQRAFRYGAAIAKIVTKADSQQDVQRVMSLYDSATPGTLIAFCMGDEYSDSRLESLSKGAPFTYAALNPDEKTAEGQPCLDTLYDKLYQTHKPYSCFKESLPCSKSFAQRAIIAAALSDGISHLKGYTPCGDSESAIKVAESLGATVTREPDGVLTIKGIGPIKEPLKIDKLDAGESGLLTRILIPLMATIGPGAVEIGGCGTLPRRPLSAAAGIMASYGVMVTNAAEREGRELYVPVNVRGKVIPGTAEVSSESGSQLISGLLMSLPLCSKPSHLYVSEPRSLPYMFITIDLLRKFGIMVSSEMEGDAQMLEQQDWSGCSGVSFKVRGGQRYRAADIELESDWSAAANYLVAGAIFGKAELLGLDCSSLQADLSIIDILVDAGACVSQGEDGSISVCKAPLESFETDLNNAPDLFPIVSVLAAFCAGRSKIAGVGRLSGKESNRAESIMAMLRGLGVCAEIQGDFLFVEGYQLSQRLSCPSALSAGGMLRGGNFSSRHDHRMVMALRVAELGASAPVEIDDSACVSKSFPSFTLQ